MAVGDFANKKSNHSFGPYEQEDYKLKHPIRSNVSYIGKIMVGVSQSLVARADCSTSSRYFSAAAYCLFLSSMAKAAKALSCRNTKNVHQSQPKCKDLEL